MTQYESLWDFIVVWALRFGSAALVFLVGAIIVRSIVGFTRRQMERRKVDKLIVEFVGNIINWALLLLVLVIALNQLGIDTTAMVALIGAAGLAIGLALQDSMKNFASGVLLIVFRPFSTGHVVDAASTSGAVEKITLFTSTLLTADNREVIVPNAAIFSSNITNYSVRPTRRIDMQFGISYSDDLRKARSLIQQVIASDSRVLADPPPDVVVGELAESSVNFYVRPWVNNDDYWPVQFDLTERIKLAFDDNGITIPYPQMDVHMPVAAEWPVPPQPVSQSPTTS